MTPAERFAVMVALFLIAYSVFVWFVIRVCQWIKTVNAEYPLPDEPSDVEPSNCRVIR